MVCPLCGIRWAIDDLDQTVCDSRRRREAKRAKSLEIERQHIEQMREILNDARTR